MATPTVYGSKASVATRRVLLTLTEKNAEYNFVAMNLAKGEQKSSDFIAKQPFGSVPLLIDGDFVLFESRAIARYIALKYAHQGPPLIPMGLKEQAIFEQAVSIETSQFEPIAAAINFERRLKKNKGLGEPDEEKCKQLVADLEVKLDAYEKILADQEYLGGDNFTLADLFHLTNGSWVEKWYPEIFASRPNVSRWWKSIIGRESWISVNAGS